MGVAVVTWECGAISRVMSRFSALEAAAFLDAFLPFFLGELFDSDRVNIHGIWVNFGGLVVSVVPLDGVGVVGLLQGNGICSVPLGLEVDSPGIPFVDCGGYSIHAIDLLHKGGGDSS